MPVGDARVSIVDGRDVAEVAAACLLSDEHDGKEFTLTGPEALTHQEIAETISGVIDAPVAYDYGHMLSVREETAHNIPFFFSTHQPGWWGKVLKAGQE